MAFAAITVNDGKATPVAHTFTPLMIDQNGVQWYQETSPAPANVRAARRLAISLKRADPSKTLDGRARVRITVYHPVMETLAPNSSGITPPPTVAYEDSESHEYVLAERGIEADHKDIRVLGSNLLLNAQVATVIDKLINP